MVFRISHVGDVCAEITEYCYRNSVDIKTMAMKEKCQNLHNFFTIPHLRNVVYVERQKSHSNLPR